MNPARKLKDFVEPDEGSERMSEIELDQITRELETAIKSHRETGEEVWAMRVKNAELKLDIFRSERDNTGTFKLKKFGKELAGLFEPDEMDRIGIEVSPDGRLNPAEHLANRRVVFVDMLELDRFNKEGGGHDAGDEGLNATASLIGEVAQKFGAYEVFRSGGNQFMLELEDVDDESYEKLLKELEEQQPSIGKGIEPAPLVVHGVDFRNVVEDVDRLQAELGTREKLATPEELSREVMEVLLRSAEWGSEVKKFVSRAERVKEKLENDPGAAEEFYNNYIKKTFQETSLSSFEDFRKLIESGEFDETVRDEAFSQARKRFELDRKEEASTYAAMDSMVRKKIVAARKEAHQAKEEKPAEGQAGAEKLAEIPAETRGQKILRERAESAKEAKTAFRKEPSPMHEELSVQKELEYQLEASRRDGGTGLLERGVYYQKMEEAFAEGKEVATVFIDMGFLKYFDKQGGRDVGNDALKLGGSLMEEAIERSGVDAEAFRYGGDEFTIMIHGDSSEAAKILQQLAILNEQAGKVSPGEKSKSDYVATELQFNYSVADSKMMDQIIADAGIGEMNNNKKTELLTKIADVGVEHLKATSRFEYLIGQMTDEAFHENTLGLEPEGESNDHTKQVESKIAFSNKALFSELGGETALRIFASELKHLSRLPASEREELEEEIHDQIRKFVLDRIDEARKKEGEGKEVLDSLLEARTKIGFLEDELRRMGAKNKEQSERMAELEESVEKARADLDQLIHTRKVIRGEG